MEDAELIQEYASKTTPGSEDSFLRAVSRHRGRNLTLDGTRTMQHTAAFFNIKFFLPLNLVFIEGRKE